MQVTETAKKPSRKRLLHPSCCGTKVYLPLADLALYEIGRCEARCSFCPRGPFNQMSVQNMTRDMRTHPVTHAEFILELTGEFAIPRLDGLPMKDLQLS
jgi:hypothetical protein